MNKQFEGRNGKTYSTELLQTILSARSLSVNVFGVPTPKFINFQQQKDWCEKQIKLLQLYSENLLTFRNIALDCMMHECEECEKLLKPAPTE